MEPSDWISILALLFSMIAIARTEYLQRKANDANKRELIRMEISTIRKEIKKAVSEISIQRLNLLKLEAEIDHKTDLPDQLKKLGEEEQKRADETNQIFISIINSMGKMSTDSLVETLELCRDLKDKSDGALEIFMNLLEAGNNARKV